MPVCPHLVKAGAAPGQDSSQPQAGRGIDTSVVLLVLVVCTPVHDPFKEDPAAATDCCCYCWGCLLLLLAGPQTRQAHPLPLQVQVEGVARLLVVQLHKVSAEPLLSTQTQGFTTVTECGGARSWWQSTAGASLERRGAGNCPWTGLQLDAHVCPGMLQICYARLNSSNSSTPACMHPQLSLMGESSDVW